MTAARETAAVVDFSQHGWLQVTGRDRLDLLQRLSTNDFRNLQPGQGLPTVLANPTGRVIALLIAHAQADAVLLRVMPHQAADVVRYFNTMIFWQDEVKVMDLGLQVRQFGLVGPESVDLLERMGATSIAATAPYASVETNIAGANVLLCRGGPLEAQDWTLVVPRSDDDTFAGELAGRAVTLDAAGFDQLRIEKGLPTWGHELSGEVTPLETNLISAISFSKGCYTGQEVIARQTNYDKVTRRLVGLILDEGAPPSLTGGVIPGPGRGGIVTSSTDTSRFGVIALAIVPRDLAEPGTTVTVQQGERTYPARITSLPFAHH